MLESPHDRHVVGADLLEAQLMAAGDPVLGTEAGSVETVDDLQPVAPALGTAGDLDTRLVPQRRNHRCLGLRAHSAEEVGGMVEIGQQPDGNIEVADADLEGLAEGARDVELLHDDLTRLFDLLLELSELFELELQCGARAAMLELDFRLQLDIVQQLHLQLESQTGDIDQRSAVGG